MEDEDVMSLLESAADEEAQTEFVPSPNDAKTIGDAANDLDERKRELDRLEAQAKGVREAVKRLETLVIPDLMRKAGIVSGTKGNFTTDSGARISLRTDIHVGVKATEQHKLLGWLRDCGDDSLIRETVHPSTLKSHVKTLLKAGTKVPEFVSVFTETRAVLTRSK